MRRRIASAAAAVLASVLTGPVLAQGAMAATVHPARLAAYWPVTITIRTVPALPGVQFSVDGRPLTTNGAGEVNYTQQHNFSSHTLRLVNTTIATPLRRYQFSRWAGQRDPNQAFRPVVGGLPMRANYTVTAGFAVQCPVKPRFTSQQGTPLDLRSISRVTLQSSAGRVVSVRPAATSWLDCLQTVYRNSALTTRTLSYSVRSVMLGGTNIVHANVERFQPSGNLTPTVVGYFHTLTIVGHDALFGTSAGGFALVTLPDRAVRRVQLGPQHTAILPNLPQGQYQVNLPTSGAIAFSDSFRLSRAKLVDVTIVSAGDLAAVGGVLALAAFGLPLVSRSRRARLLGLLRRVAETTGRATALRRRTAALLHRDRLPES